MLLTKGASLSKTSLSCAAGLRGSTAQDEPHSREIKVFQDRLVYQDEQAGNKHPGTGNESSQDDLGGRLAEA